ncbi:MAG: polysaccharide deacetylase family protein [Tabrizicola sp.]|nr:polysaccharide deacetylase family protein [Tabrizicola sp.]
MSDFRAHVAYLRTVYDIVSMDQAEAEGPARKRAGQPRAVLTFDDGEAGLFRHLLPIVEAIELPVTVYVATGQIESGRAYWFDRVMAALGTGAREVELEGLGQWRIPDQPGPDRWTALGDLLEALKRAAPDHRERLTDVILAKHPLPEGRPPLAPLTMDELVTLAASPWITIGAHSHCHSLLDQISLSEATESIARSRRLLQDWTGQEVAHFAWPNGNRNAALGQAASDCGFRTATALGGWLWHPGADPYAIPRVPVGRYDDTARLALRLVGL